ncbi:beta-galactosidase [Bifidobacterium sp. ESL0800]|uniref:beta-galactosidase n=1 Tax=Bifidobacterium sp. ESL0800 TaxID=2983236 RepID=UPI0023F9B533|nr:beta-galactosidase [Bifidobacterium sp. ESL0800]WEV75893.1 beta-galactosidase [Bifidobacterium sp. ESL0800]
MSSKKILFGAAYYPEYQRSSHLDEDIRLMRGADVNIIRVGEGSWSHWEPEDGVFDLDWLEPTLDKAYENGISAIIGMPTFAIPQWMARKHPEIALRNPDGSPMPYGWREEHNYSQSSYVFYEHRIIEQIVRRYASHPAVIGWQLHNEPGLRIDYSVSSFEGFKDYLRHKYRSVENLNEQWGLVFWSHELSTWDDLWKPAGNCQPQYDIEWRRYQALLTDEMLGRQRAIVERYRRPDQVITVNAALGRDTFDEGLSAQRLDVAGSDIYYQMQNSMSLKDPEPIDIDWVPAGAWQTALLSDRTYAMKQEPFYVMETDGGAIGGSADKFPSFPGQQRLGAWQMVARGSRMIEYWHWRQTHFGTEMYWGAILPHDGKPGRVYKETAALGHELRAASADLEGLVPDADVAMLYSVDSRWALSYEPPIANDYSRAAHRTRNPKVYDEISEAFYKGVFLTGHQARIVFDKQLTGELSTPQDFATGPAAFAKRYPVLIAVAQYVSDDALLQWLRQYVLAGGHLILGPRSTYADDLARAREETMPAMLGDLAKASYQEFSALPHDLKVKAENGASIRQGSCATKWLDYLCGSGSTVLARVRQSAALDVPVVTTAAAGAGRVTMVGTVPNADLAASILDFALPASPWLPEHDFVTHNSAVNAKGERLHWLFNFSDMQVHEQLAVPCTALDGQRVVVDFLRGITLRPWDVAVLKEVAI